MGVVLARWDSSASAGNARPSPLRFFLVPAPAGPAPFSNACRCGRPGAIPRCPGIARAGRATTGEIPATDEAKSAFVEETSTFNRAVPTANQGVSAFGEAVVTTVEAAATRLEAASTGDK